jgi:hypothetical protein
VAAAIGHIARDFTRHGRQPVSGKQGKDRGQPSVWMHSSPRSDVDASDIIGDSLSTELIRKKTPTTPARYFKNCGGGAAS